jgi:hypothetical protein
MLDSVAIHLESNDACSVEFDGSTCYLISGGGRALIEHIARLIVQHRLGEELREKNKRVSADLPF